MADSAVAAGERLRIAPTTPAKAALVGFWLEQSQERARCEALLSPLAAGVHGYLVVESRPLVADAALRGADGRVAGFHLCTGVRKRGDLGHADFLRYWYDEQRACALETQATFAYTRNEVVRALTTDAPDLSAIVEEGFPTAALDDPAEFYDAVGDPERLARHVARMVATCRRFLDMESIDSHPMSRYEFD